MSNPQKPTLRGVLFRAGILAVTPFLVAHYGILLGAAWAMGTVYFHGRGSPVSVGGRPCYQTTVLTCLHIGVSAQIGAPWVTTWPSLARAYARFLRAVARVSPSYVMGIIAPAYTPVRGMSVVVVNLGLGELPPFPGDNEFDIQIPDGGPR